MSLVRASKSDSSLIIVSDTKLTYCTDSTNQFKENHPITGAIKSIIISPKLCICFAGEVLYAEKLLTETKEIDSVDSIINKAIDVHKLSYDNGCQTDFIIAHCNETIELVEIKDRKAQNVETSWIGDYDAFRKYQEVYHSNNQDIIDHPGVGLSLRKLPDNYNEQQREEYTKMFNAMKAVIDDNSVNSVGGFVVPIVFEDNNFKYNLYYDIYRRELDNSELDGPISFGSTELGSHSVNFYSSKKNVVAVHWKFGNLGIVYSPNDKGMLLPEYYSSTDEIDFEYVMDSKYGISPGGSIGSDEYSYYRKAHNLYNVDFNKSNWLLHKAIESIAIKVGNRYKVEVQSLAQFMELNPAEQEIDFMKVCQYNYGVTFYYLGDFESARNCMERALYIDSDYQDAIRTLSVINIETTKNRE